MLPSPADISISESSENEPTAVDSRYQFRFEVFGPASPTVSSARTSSPGWVGIVPMVGMMLRARELDGQVAGRDSDLFARCQRDGRAESVLCLKRAAARTVDE